MAGKHVQKNTRKSQTRREDREYYERSSAAAERRDRGGQRSTRSASRTESRGRVRWLIPVLIILILVVFALGGLMAYASKIASIDTIYPNITVGGVDVGGMTVEQAAAVLDASGTAPYTSEAATVKLPLGKTLTVTAEEAGIVSDTKAAAEAAYSYGRGGSMLQNLKAYRACQKTPVALDWNTDVPIDEEAIRTIVHDAVTEVNALLLESDAQIGEDGVTLVKGTNAAAVDENEVVDLVIKAFRERDYTEINVDVTKTDTEGEDEYALLESVYESIHVDMKNAEYDKETGGVTESVRGVSFDMQTARELWHAANPGEEVFIPFVFTEPEVDSETLSSRLFGDLLSEKSTTLSGSSSNRINNITLAAKAMNDTILNPGDEFDYNSCLGQRTTARGYKEAGAYSAGQHVSEVGGGICQGSSTLYYCAIYANLDITLRSCHYFTVSYLPRGFDATVSWGGPNFRFVNSRDYPIKIKAWVSDGYLTVQIWGTNLDGSYVKATSETWEDSTYYYAQTYRTVYAADGSVISNEKEAYSKYAKYESGAEETPSATSTAAPTATPAPTNPPPSVTDPPPAVTDPPPVVTDPPPVVTDPPPVVTDPPPVVTDPPPAEDPEPDPDPDTGGEGE